ncbi:uncharacterized protein LOC136038286 isoform X1 [Artemia franciscana]|uniref:uncharacterized protein LOC136038286 isoform X1 n=1 Tax=Artemia franciscana TaxID=6661 RepID=UPI0032DA1C64
MSVPSVALILEHLKIDRTGLTCPKPQYPKSYWYQPDPKSCCQECKILEPTQSTKKYEKDGEQDEEAQVCFPRTQCYRVPEFRRYPLEEYCMLAAILHFDDCTCFCEALSTFIYRRSRMLSRLYQVTFRSRLSVHFSLTLFIDP